MTSATSTFLTGQMWWYRSGVERARPSTPVPAQVEEDTGEDFSSELGIAARMQGCEIMQARPSTPISGQVKQELVITELANMFLRQLGPSLFSEEKQQVNITGFKKGEGQGGDTFPLKEKAEKTLAQFSKIISQQQDKSIETGSQKELYTFYPHCTPAKRKNMEDSEGVQREIDPARFLL